MKWITASQATNCYDCNADIWRGATMLLRDRGIYCAPCGRSLERRLKEREGMKRGAFAHGKATEAPND